MSSLGGLWIWEFDGYFLFIEDIKMSARKGQVTFTCSTSGDTIYAGRDEIRQLES